MGMKEICLLRLLGPPRRTPGRYQFDRWCPRRRRPPPLKSDIQ